jgi:predicted permease
MGPLTRTIKKLSLLFGRRRFHRELDEEMEFHREQAAREFIAGGMKPEAARFAAMRQFGNFARLRERSQEAVEFRFETVVQDLGFTMRQFRRNPGFAASSILILALGMGVSVAIFGFVDAALLRPLPYAEPNRLMSVDEMSEMFPRSDLSYDDYLDWKRLNRTFSSIEVYGGTGYLLRTSSGAEPVPAARVSDGFFRTLGVRPMLGRDFLPGEDQPGRAKIAMLSYGTWLNRFSGRREVVGQMVNLSGESYTVVGVLPPEFAFAPRGNAEVWVPLLDKNGCEQRRSCHNLDGIGRLRDGVTMQAASADLKAIAAGLERQYPGSNQGQGSTVVPLAEIVVGDVRPILLTLLSGAGLLLLIACVNVASLLLVRSESRKREIAVRGALGATRARLVRQFVTEGLFLAMAGSAVGVAIAAWLMTLLAHLVPKDIAVRLHFLSDVGINVHTAAFAAGVALGAAVLLALTPTLRLSFLEIQAGLVEGGRSSAGRLWRKLGANLVVVELAVAVVLLTGAALLGQSFYHLLHVERGFDSTHLATTYVMAPGISYKRDEQLTVLYSEIIRRVASLPGVQQAGLTSDLPVQCNCDTDWIRILGKPFHGEHNEVNQRDVTAGYLPALKARLLRGRFIADSDGPGKPRVVVINESLARKYFPGEDPIGKKIGDGGLTPNSMREVVGVVADVREGALDAEVWPAEYQPISQGPDHNFAVAVRAAGDEKTLLPALVSTLHGIDPNLGVYGETTMVDQIDATQAALLHRFSTWLVGGFALVALLLGVVGLYGAIAYSVSQRTREIGVRMALGSQRSSVYRLVLNEASRLIAVGLVLGLAGSVGAATLMRTLLFGVQAWDAATLLGVATVLAASAMLASYFPARRAASVNPTDALRAE